MSVENGNSKPNNPEVRDAYQKRLDAGESIATLARENGVSHSTMRWRLKKLGIDLSKRAETDGRFGAGGRAEFLVSAYHGTMEVDAKIDRIATENNIDLSNCRGIDEKMDKLLRVLVLTRSNIQIGQIMGVSEKAVRKWVKKYGINTLGRGDWAKVRAGKITVKEILLD